VRRAAVIVSLLWAPGALAIDKDACVQAYEQAQELRQEGKLRKAHEKLLECAQTECPEFVQSDCARWSSEVSAALPSIVLAVRDREGHDLTEVSVEMDDEPLAVKFDGSPTPVDPGPHRLVVRRAGSKPAERDVVIAQGEKSRVLRIVLEPEEAPPPAAAPAPAEPAAESAGDSRETLGWIVGGIGVAGLASFGFFALSGKSRESELEKSCKPNCPDSDVDEVRAKYLIADISLGVGVAGIGVGAWLILSADPPQEGAAAATSLGVRPLPGGASATLVGSF
jgi:hypothetical protein